MNKRSPFQYSLRTLFIVISVTALLMGLLAPIARALPEQEVALWTTFGFFYFVTLSFLVLVSLNEHRKTSDPLSPQPLKAFRSAMQAQVLVNALAEENIRAVAVGGYTAGFCAEAPGEVQVEVASQDLPRASEVLEKFEADAEGAAQFGQESAETEE